MTIESSAIFYMSLAVGSVALSFSIALALRWVSKPSHGSSLSSSLSSVEKAYLVGGPIRSVEMALFLAVREGWARHDGSGFFLTRVKEPPETLSSVERELLLSLSESEGMSVSQLRAQIKSRSSSALDSVESSLVQKGMILSEGEFRLVNLLSLLPILGAIGIGSVRAIAESSQKHGFEIPLVTIGCLVFIMMKFKNRFRRRTRLGDAAIRQLREQALGRPRVRTNRRPEYNSETDGSPYDRIRDIEDDILFSGLGALIGTAFAPISTFMPDSNKSKDAFQWGTVERDQGLPDSQNSRVKAESD